LAQHTFYQLDDETQQKVYLSCLVIMGKQGLEPRDSPDAAVAAHASSTRLAAIFGVDPPKYTQTNDLVAWAFMSLSLQQLGIPPNLVRRPIPKWKAMGTARHVLAACERAPEDIGQLVINDLEKKHGIRLQERGSRQI